MSNYFVKFFDAIQDRVARHELEEEIKLDKLFGRNKLAGKTTFEGIVMSDPAGSSAETTNGSTANRFVAVKVYIKDLDDHMFDFDILKNITDEKQKTKLLNNLIGGCYTAYPDSALYSSEPDPKFQAGCTVELKFADQGPQTTDHGRMRGLRYTKVTRLSDDRYSGLAKFFVGNVSNLFENESTVLGDVAPLAFSKSRTKEFIDRMKVSGFFNGFSDAALAGIAANATAESGIYARAAGDANVNGARTRSVAATSEYLGKSKQGDWCSFGFFQLNVCGEGAEGMLIAKKNGWMDESGNWKEPDGKEKFKEWVYYNNGENQLRYVAGRLKQLIPNYINTDKPYDFGYQMTVKFEKPVKKEEKGQQRGLTADEIYKSWKNK
jgi:hypothetical protein